MNDNTSGRRWARTFLGIALLVSVIGNVAHTVLAHSLISLWLRVPGAVIWPVFTFGAIEIIVRMIWEKSWTHNIARNILLLPAVPAAITSYEHLWALLKLMGETAFIATIGPLAIDGMMIGCTMVLLFTRPTAATVEPLPVQNEVSATQPIEPDVNWDLIDWDREMIEMDKPVSPAPIPVIPGPVKERAPRARWDARRVCELALDGVKAATASDETGIGQSTYARYLAVARILQADPRATIDSSRKVPAEHVAILRDLVTR